MRLIFGLFSHMNNDRRSRNCLKMNQRRLMLNMKKNVFAAGVQGIEKCKEKNSYPQEPSKELSQSRNKVRFQ